LFEQAFAITVHKSQGSEYENILIALPQDGGNRLLTKEIVYTALTRARRSAVIYGSRDILSEAVSRRIERQSGLRLWV
nr:ATP-binding domain-containing protein [Candidatus Omnitrophota bacterium]